MTFGDGRAGACDVIDPMTRNDNLISVTDPLSLVTNYNYNGFGDQLRA
jgi:hypothetical protein